MHLARRDHPARNEARGIGYKHAPRAGGRTKRGTWARLRLQVNRLTSLAIAPWRWATIVGVTSAAAAGLLGLWIVAQALLVDEGVQGSESLALAIGFLSGMQRLDEQLFVFLNSLGSERWDSMWLLITNKYSWAPLLAALLYLAHRHFGLKNMLIVVALITVMITTTDQLANIFKHGFERPRPCQEGHLQELIRYIAPRCGRYGFFSAHAASSMAFAVYLGLLFRRIHRPIGFILLFVALIVGSSRVYVGVHYPLDTLTGFFIGAVVGFLIYKISQRLNLSGDLHGPFDT